MAAAALTIPADAGATCTAQDLYHWLKIEWVNVDRLVHQGVLPQPIGLSRSGLVFDTHEVRKYLKRRVKVDPET